MTGRGIAYQSFAPALRLGMSTCTSRRFGPRHTAEDLPGHPAFAGFRRLIPPWGIRAPVNPDVLPGT